MTRKLLLVHQFISGSHESFMRTNAALRHCITHWFDSIEAFEETVKTLVVESPRTLQSATEDIGAAL